MTVGQSEYSSGPNTPQSDMPHPESDPTAPADEHLAEPPVRAYLGEDEAVQAVLTNTRVGVARADEDGVDRIEPGSDCGAVAVLTSRRVLFVVGRPDGDEATSVPYVEFDGVETRTEMLARTFVVETAAGAIWEFTVRESDALDDAVAYLASEVPARLLDQAEKRREEATETDDCEQRIEALEASVDAFRRATTVVEESDIATEATREEAESVIADLVETYLARARNRRSVGNWSAETGEVDEALDHYDEATDCFERALELARTYPPGDADAIATEREDLLEKRDAVEVTASVSSALD